MRWAKDEATIEDNRIPSAAKWQIFSPNNWIGLGLIVPWLGGQAVVSGGPTQFDCTTPSAGAGRNAPFDSSDELERRWIKCVIQCFYHANQLKYFIQCFKCHREIGSAHLVNKKNKWSTQWRSLAAAIKTLLVDTVYMQIRSPGPEMKTV